MTSEAKGNKKPLLKYKLTVPDREWELEDRRGNKHAGKYRGSPWRPDQVPAGPRLQWGSRLGMAVDSRSKGVFFGTPGLPRFTYATTKVQPSLGPPSGLPKAHPPRVSESFPSEFGTHLQASPASFVLEGVVGFNPSKAKEIRRLRGQLGGVEEIFGREDGRLRAELRSSRQYMENYAGVINAEDIRRRDLEDRKEQLRKELTDVRKMIDEQATEIKARKKSIMREEMRASSEKSGERTPPR